ncbi:DUF4349 domain-containing protein [Streptomyces sp. NPDC014891]|uniref:DUF4349 domain-containing protein n=1 Tax=Streptomyces sp. NPDC014891 TaxID=3364929 RepID=UPI0036F62EC1
MRSARTTARTRAAAGGVLLAAALVLTGCGAGGDMSGDAKRDLSAADAKGGAERGAADGYTGPDAGKPSAAPSKAPARQHVIRTASLAVEVGDVTKALATARDVTAAAGGRVENESTERVEEGDVVSRVVLRVPQERYDAVLGELTGTGRLLSRTADAKDVTEQVVDVESRIATQRASVARVRALMDRAEKLADVVTLEGELSRRQADLESLLAQQASLRDRTSLATITLELSQKEKPREEEGGEGRPGFGDALSGGWNSLVGAASWAVVVLAALAPWLAVALAGYLVWSRVVRPRRTGRAARTAPPAGPAAVPAARRNAAGAAVPPADPDAPGSGE